MKTKKRRKAQLERILIADYQHGNWGDAEWVREALYLLPNGDYILKGEGGAFSSYRRYYDANGNQFGPGSHSRRLDREEAEEWVTETRRHRGFDLYSTFPDRWGHRVEPDPQERPWLLGIGEDDGRMRAIAQRHADDVDLIVEYGPDYDLAYVALTTNLPSGDPRRREIEAEVESALA